jgi:hypothetical protein
MRRSVTTIAALCLVLAACGDDESSSTTVATVAASTTMVATPSTTTATTIATTTTTTIPSTTTTTEPPAEPFDAVEVAFDITIDATSSVAAGTFVASGSAVDLGLMCSRGTTFEASWERTSGGELWETRFKCDDGSGSFSIEVLDAGDWQDGTWVHSGAWTWVTEKGKGSYLGVSGEGIEDGACASGTCNEVYSGEIMRNS